MQCRHPACGRPVGPRAPRPRIFDPGLPSHSNGLNPPIAPITRCWLVHARLNLSFLQPIAMLWVSVQPCVQPHLSCAIIRSIGTMGGLPGPVLPNIPVLATSNGHPRQLLPAWLYLLHPCSRAHLTPTPLACSAHRWGPAGLPPTGCHQGLSKIGPKRAKTSKACSGLGRLSQDL